MREHGQIATHGTRQNFSNRRKTAEWQTLILWSSDAVTSSCPRAVKQSWFTAALWPHTLPTYHSNGNHNLQQVWFGLLVFNDTFSRNRLHRALGVWNIYCAWPGKHIQLTTYNSTVKFTSIATVSPPPLLIERWRAHCIVSESSLNAKSNEEVYRNDFRDTWNGHGLLHQFETCCNPPTHTP